MIIDSHQHFWHYSPDTHDWIGDDMQVLRRDFLPTDLAPILKQNGVSGCVAVQASQSLEETDFLLDLAEKHPFILGVVGWVDLQAHDLGKQLERWQGRSKLKGFRHVIQDETDPHFMDQLDFMEGLKTLAMSGYTYDLLIRSDQLKSSINLVRGLPELHFVLDHIAKPPIAYGEMEPWKSEIRILADFPNVHCKLSGMITEADWVTWNQQDLRPYLEVVMEAFGPKRLMFGSDWPVCLLAGKYEAAKSVVADFISSLSDGEQASIWGENAQQFYGLKE